MTSLQLRLETAPIVGDNINSVVAVWAAHLFNFFLPLGIKHRLRFRVAFVPFVNNFFNDGLNLLR
jgi:hypothetical protein